MQNRHTIFHGFYSVYLRTSALATRHNPNLFGFCLAARSVMGITTTGSGEESLERTIVVEYPYLSYLALRFVNIFYYFVDWL